MNNHDRVITETAPEDVLIKAKESIHSLAKRKDIQYELEQRVAKKQSCAKRMR